MCMNSMQTLLDMVATEAFERDPVEIRPDDTSKEASFQYTTELIRTPDGKLEWVEEGLPN